MFTLAGTEFSGFLDGVGALARFECPSDLTIDDMGNIVVVEIGNNAVRLVTSSG